MTRSYTEDADCTVLRILTETADTRMSLAKLVSASGLPRKQVQAALHVLIKDQLVREVDGTFNKFIYVLVNRTTAAVEPATPLWWQKGELRGYETKIRAFMSACNSSR